VGQRPGVTAEETDVGGLLRLGQRALGGGENGLLDAQVLLGFAMRATREWLYAHPEASPGRQASREYRRLVAKRAGTGCPIAYLTGVREFSGLALAMARGVFIPRPETEGLVGLVESWFEGGNFPRDGAVVVDACCGSGAIGVALACRLGIRILATDISREAVKLTGLNAARHGVGDLVQALTGSCLDPVKALSPCPAVRAVVANPPYVTTAEMAGLPRDIADFEPPESLCGGEDGLDVIRILARDSARALAPGGLLALEIGAGQADAVRDTLSRARFGRVRISKDLAGLPRYARAVK